MRNPYVVLGVPFGASGDTAAAAFARKARGLRRAPGGTERLQHLTWALNQIQELLRQPHLALEVYRVPADPGALEPEGQGVLRPPPERMPRSTTPAGEWDGLLHAVRDEVVIAARVDVARHSVLPAR
jgi:hypothetical protein